MQMNALRSANFAKLSSNSSTSDEYWVTSMSDGTPAGYCLSQIRSMVSPLYFYLYCLLSVLLPVALAGLPCFRQYWQCGSRWQAAARYRRIGALRANGPTLQMPLKSAGWAARLTGRLG